MPVHPHKINDMLPEFGWELVEARHIAYLWVAEIWLVRSTWTPNDCRLYLTFEIDGQADSRDVSQVWAIKASLNRPVDWVGDEGSNREYDFTLEDATRILPIGKERDLASLFEGMAILRSVFASKEN